MLSLFLVLRALMRYVQIMPFSVRYDVIRGLGFRDCPLKALSCFITTTANEKHCIFLYFDAKTHASDVLVEQEKCVSVSRYGISKLVPKPV